MDLRRFVQFSKRYDSFLLCSNSTSTSNTSCVRSKYSVAVPEWQPTKSGEDRRGRWTERHSDGLHSMQHATDDRRHAKDDRRRATDGMQPTTGSV